MGGTGGGRDKAWEGFVTRGRRDLARLDLRGRDGARAEIHIKTRAEIPEDPDRKFAERHPGRNSLKEPVRRLVLKTLGRKTPCRNSTKDSRAELYLKTSGRHSLEHPRPEICPLLYRYNFGYKEDLKKPHNCFCLGDIKSKMESAKAQGNNLNVIPSVISEKRQI